MRLIISIPGSLLCQFGDDVIRLDFRRFLRSDFPPREETAGCVSSSGMSVGSFSEQGLVIEPIMSFAPEKSAGDARYASQDPFIHHGNQHCPIQSPLESVIRSAFFRFDVERNDLYTRLLLTEYNTCAIIRILKEITVEAVVL